MAGLEVMGGGYNNDRESKKSMHGNKAEGQWMAEKWVWLWRTADL